MLKHRHIDKICCIIIASSLIITILFMNGGSFGIINAQRFMGYEEKLFDTSYVHTIDIIIDNWDEFLSTATSEEYSKCDIIIDNEIYENVAIRGKGNSSLTSVSSYGNDRYSFKVELDHYISENSYYGLDKICLNNIIQDSTYLKDYLTYTMMNDMNVCSPLCSFVFITVNGEDWGLYLAVEGIEESFLQRNYGANYGELYKPDSMNMNANNDNGEKFSMGDNFENFPDRFNFEASEFTNENDENLENFILPANLDENNISPNMQRENQNEIGGMGMKGGMGGRMNSEDVMLQYIDDNVDSYSNIFNGAKTDVTSADEARLIASLKSLSEGKSIESIVDIETVIRYFVVNDFVQNGDSYTGSMVHNYYLYEKSGILSMIPWDYNLAFGGFGGGSDATSIVNAPIDSPVSSGELESRPMISWIFDNEAYTELYHQYYSEFIKNYFDSGYFEQMYDNVVTLLSPYVEKDPTAFYTYDEFQTGTTTLKEICLLRSKSVYMQLNGSIPSTSEGQSDDKTSLIDASHLNLSDTGSMGNAFGGNKGNNMPNFPNIMSSESETNISNDDTQTNQPLNPNDENNNSNDNSTVNIEENINWNRKQFGGQANMPDENSSNMQSTFILLGVSILVMIGGIIFAVKFRQH